MPETDLRAASELAGLDRLLEGLAGQAADRVRRRRPRRRWVAGTVSLLAAAAAIAALVLVTGDRAPSDGSIGSAARLDVASSRPFVLFPTSRDDMTVIWLLEPEAP